MIKPAGGLSLVMVSLACSCAAKPRSLPDGAVDLGAVGPDQTAASTGGRVIGSGLESATGGTGGAGHIASTTGGAGIQASRSSTRTSLECGQPSKPSHGSVTSSGWNQGSTATYACDPGFLLSGPATRTCLADGVWSDSQPTCVVVDVTCEPLATIANGVVSAPFTAYGAIANYYCSSRYTLQGNATRTCQMDGTWSGTTPACICDVTCDDVCTDIQSDSKNCGGCGIVCPTPTSPSTTQCMLGRCLVTLYSSDPELGARFTDVATDARNIYWVANSYLGGKDAVMKMPLGGGAATVLASGHDIVGNMVVNQSGIYWVRLTDDGNYWYGDLMNVPLDGGNPVTLVAHQLGCGEIAVDAANIYWITQGALKKQALVGGTPVTLASLTNNYRFLGIDANYLYWASYGSVTVIRPPDDGAVMRVPLGGGVPIALASELPRLGALIVDAHRAYWSTGASIMSLSLDGGVPIRLAEGPAVSLAVDASNLYWANGADRYSGGAVMKVPLGGGTVTRLALAQDGPASIAVDDTSVYWSAGDTLMKLSPK